MRAARAPSVTWLSIAAAWLVFAVYGVLFGALLWGLTGSTPGDVFRSPRTWFSLRLSLVTATVAAVLAMLVGIPAGYALSRCRFSGRKVLDALLELPMIVSPAALGALLLIFFSSPAGQWLQRHTVQVVFTAAGVVLAQVITVLGVAVRLSKAAFDGVPAELETVARTLGARPWRVWQTVTLPLARRSLAAAFLISWAKALGEFGATIMVAGSMALRTETLPIAIYLRLASADISGAVMIIAVLVTVGLGVSYVARRLLGDWPHA